MNQAEQTLDLLTRTDKTELTDKYSNVAAIGSEFGIPWMWWWHRISAGWGSVRHMIAQLAIFDEDEGVIVTPEAGRRVWKPNHLRQEIKILDLEVAEDKFIHQDSLVTTIRIRNLAKTKRNLRLYFKGKVEGRCKASLLEKQNVFCITEMKDYGDRYIPSRMDVHQLLGCTETFASWAIGSAVGDVEKFMARDFDKGAFISDSHIRKYVKSFEGEGFCHMLQINLELPPGEERIFNLACTFSRDLEDGLKRQNTLLNNAGNVFAENMQEQTQYLLTEVPQFNCPDERVNRLWYFLHYVIRANRSKKGRAVKADFTVPTKFGYWGCYVWDTAFHVLAELFLHDKEIAKDSLRALLSVQYPNGYIPVNSGADALEIHAQDGHLLMDPCALNEYSELDHPFLGRMICKYKTPHQWGSPQVRKEITVREMTMTPIIGIAAWEIYKATGDQEYLAEIYPALSKFDDWMWRRRNNGDGLLIWYDGCESGWDNCARHYPLPTKAVDGASHVYLLRRVLSDISKVLGKDEDAEKFNERAEATRKGINECMWDEKSGFYYCMSEFNIRKPQKSLAGFMPLLAGVASESQHDCLRKHLKDPEEFWTKYPVPTLSKDDPDFDTFTWGWNGPVWIQTNWFVMEGFARYGDFESAHDVFAKTVDLLCKDGPPTAGEHYNCETGDVISCPDYSWCGALNHYIVTRICGIQPFAAENRVEIDPRPPRGWDNFRLEELQVGEHTLSLLCEDSAGKRTLTITHSGSTVLRASVVFPRRDAIHAITSAGRDVPKEHWKTRGNSVIIEVDCLDETVALETKYHNGVK